MSTKADRLLERMTDSPRGRQVALRASLAQQLGAMVYEMRTSREYTQQALAERSDVPQSAISRLESGNQGFVPRLELLLRLAQACGYSLNLRAVPDDSSRDPQRRHTSGYPLQGAMTIEIARSGFAEHESLSAGRYSDA